MVGREILDPDSVPIAGLSYARLPLIHGSLEFGQFPVSQDPLVFVDAIELDMLEVQDEVKLLLVWFALDEFRANFWCDAA